MKSQEHPQPVSFDNDHDEFVIESMGAIVVLVSGR